MAYLSPVQFADTNIAGTTLVGTIIAGDNTLTLTSAAVLGSPSSPSFDILIDNEYITVNGVSGNVCTPLSRGANGSTPAGHAAGAAVYAPITVGMINAAMARIDQANAAGFQSPSLTPSGLYAAVQSVSRVVGAVAPGVGTAWTPAGGPYAVGDIVWDVSNATFYLCTVAGSPGTWIGAPSLKLAQTWALDQTLAGNLKFSAASAKIIPGATSLLVRNNADNATNLGFVDAGIGTMRNALEVPPSAGASLPTHSYGTLPVKLDEQSGTNVANLTLTVPSGALYRNLKVYLTVKTTSGAAQQISIQFNTDTGANYDFSFYNHNNNTLVAGTPSVAQTGARIAAAVPSTAAGVTFSEMVIANADSTTQRKVWTYRIERWDGDAAANSVSEWGHGQWRNTANAITSIKIFGTANFDARAILWGEP